jgi:hypothetical protein
MSNRIRASLGVWLSDDLAIAEVDSKPSWWR